MSSKLVLEALSSQELENLIIRASEEIERRKMEEAKIVREKIKDILEDSGFTLNDVFKERNPRKGRKVPIQFQNPDNPEQKWSGRGRMPIWMRIKVEKEGANKEDFRIELEEE